MSKIKETRQAAVERVLDMQDLPFKRKAQLLADILFGEIPTSEPGSSEQGRKNGEDTEAST